MYGKRPKAIFSIFGGFLTHVVLGALYLWGNISVYVASYYNYNGYPGLKASTVQAVFPSIYIGIAIGHFVGLNSARKFGHKLVSFINMLIYCGSYLVASRVGFYAFLVFMGFLPGLCIGNEYMIPVDNAYYYYPHRKGLVGGLILCGLGFGAIIFNPIFQVIINPNGETNTYDGYYSPEIANRFPQALRWATMIYACMGILGVLMMFQTKRYLQMKGDLSESLVEQTKAYNEECERAEVKITSMAEGFRTHHVYIMWAQFYLCSGFGLLIASSYKQYGLLHINDDNFLVLIGSFGGLANGCSRFLWATLLDYVPYNILIPINTLMMMTLSFTLDYIADIKALYLIWIVLVYLQYGGLYSFYPTMGSRVYGPRFGPKMYNVVATATAFSNLTWFVLLNFAEPHIGYRGIYWIFTAFGVVSLALHTVWVILDKKSKKTYIA